jgi:hypothetical protein
MQGQASLLGGQVEMSGFFGKSLGRQLGDAEFWQWRGIAPAGQTICCVQPKQAPPALFEPSLAGQPGVRKGKA